MKKNLPVLLAGAAVGLAMTLPVAAQTSAGPGTDTGRSSSALGMSGSSDWSLLPFTRRGYVGLNLGRSEFDTGCAIGFECGQPSLSGSIYTGGLLNEWLGAELGYMNSGTADRSGGTTRAQALSLSAVGRIPLGSFNVYGKLGAAWGETRVSASPLSGVVEGKERGWGPVYAIGAGFDFTRNSGVVLEWSRHELPFAGLGRQPIDTTSLGYVFRF